MTDQLTDADRRSEREARLLAAAEGLQAARKPVTARRLANALGWSHAAVAAVLGHLAARGLDPLTPDSPAGARPAPADPDEQPDPDEPTPTARPDIAAECARIRAGWDDGQWALRTRRARGRVETRRVKVIMKKGTNH